MLKRFASVIVIAALCCTLGVQTAFARGSAEPESKSKAADLATTPVGTTKSEVAPAEKPNEKLRADVLKLVADAKAGKVTIPVKSQIQPAKSNNWSTGAKIAVGVGIAAAIVAVIFLVQYNNNEQ
jgi:uncharacterized membrane protein